MCAGPTAAAHQASHAREHTNGELSFLVPLPIPLPTVLLLVDACKLALVACKLVYICGVSK